MDVRHVLRRRKTICRMRSIIVKNRGLYVITRRTKISWKLAKRIAIIRKTASLPLYMCTRSYHPSYVTIFSFCPFCIFDFLCVFRRLSVKLFSFILFVNFHVYDVLPKFYTRVDETNVNFSISLTRLKVGPLRNLPL